MKQSAIKLTTSEQDQILQASYEPGCIISELARQHGIPSRFIYHWRSKKKKKSVMEISTTPTLDFVELSVNQPFKKAVSLKRAVLEFNNLSISIDGNIKSSILLQMLNILEESC
jgi:transposase-like protein